MYTVKSFLRRVYLYSRQRIWCVRVRACEWLDIYANLFMRTICAVDMGNEHATPVHRCRDLPALLLNSQTSLNLMKNTVKQNKTRAKKLRQDKSDKEPGFFFSFVAHTQYLLCFIQLLFLSNV